MPVKPSDSEYARFLLIETFRAASYLAGLSPDEKGNYRQNPLSFDEIQTQARSDSPQSWAFKMILSGVSVEELNDLLAVEPDQSPKP